MAKRTGASDVRTGLSLSLFATISAAMLLRSNDYNVEMVSPCYETHETMKTRLNARLTTGRYYSWNQGQQLSTVVNRLLNKAIEQERRACDSVTI